MPYSVVENHEGCPSDSLWGVVKDADGELMGCHPSESEALDQVAALYASEGEGEATTAPWRGPLAVEGIVTGDGREFSPGSLVWPEDIAPGEVVLRWNKEDSHGGEPHTVAVNVGRIDRIWRDGNRIMGEGLFNLKIEDGRISHEMVKDGFLRGISIDADSITDADIELIWPENDTIGEEEDDDLFELLFAQPEKTVFHKGRIRAATLVDIPAFAEAYIELLDETGAVVAGGTRFQPGAVTELPENAVTASLNDPWNPPEAWFRDPKLSLPTNITVDASGRIYGHAAPWGTCHIGYANECMSVPREDGHPYFMTGELVTAEGSVVSVGQITVGTGHANTSSSAQAAVSHYDNTGWAVADVAVGNDAHGIWVAGAIRPNAESDRVHQLGASGKVSGDWRRIGGKLRLVGLLAVNVPGFPIPKMRARVASGVTHSLVAAGGSTTMRPRVPEINEQQAFRVVMDAIAKRIRGGD